MCVFVCVYMHVCVLHVCVCVYVCVYVRVNACVCMCVCVYIEHCLLMLLLMLPEIVCSQATDFYTWCTRVNYSFVTLISLHRVIAPGLSKPVVSLILIEQYCRVRHFLHYLKY